MQIALTKPITAHGKTLSAIDLRAPTGGDIRKCGMPFKIIDEAGATRFDFDTESCAKYFSALGDIPPSSVDQLAADDFLTLMNELVPLFGTGSQKTPSTDTGSSPDSSVGGSASST